MLTVSHNVDISVTTISVTLMAFTCAELLFGIYTHDMQMYSGISIRLWSLENIVNAAIASYTLTLENLVQQSTSEAKVIESKWRTITLRDY